MDIRVQPDGPFSGDPYGATYGILKGARRELSPSERKARVRLPDDAAKRVQEVTKVIGAELQNNGLILMTTSGIDLDAASPFFGPHVGSYYNMLLKRALLRIGCPKVIFLDESKWGMEFILNNCHAVCDDEMPWQKLKAESPLAIAIAATGVEKREALRESLRTQGFVHQQCGELKAGLRGALPIIATNEPFHAFFH
jgi:hypothetical protein